MSEKKCKDCLYFLQLYIKLDNEHLPISEWRCFKGIIPNPNKSTLACEKGFRPKIITQSLYNEFNER